jgi:hypothetical protein
MNGYLKDVLIAKDVPAEVKVALANYLITAKAPIPTPTVTKAIGTASGSGDTNLNVTPVSTRFR